MLLNTLENSAKRLLHTWESFKGGEIKASLWVNPSANHQSGQNIQQQRSTIIWGPGLYWPIRSHEECRLLSKQLLLTWGMENGRQISKNVTAFPKFNLWTWNKEIYHSMEVRTKVDNYDRLPVFPVNSKCSVSGYYYYHCLWKIRVFSCFGYCVIDREQSNYFFF